MLLECFRTQIKVNNLQKWHLHTCCLLEKPSLRITSISHHVCLCAIAIFIHKKSIYKSNKINTCIQHHCRYEKSTNYSYNHAEFIHANGMESRNQCENWALTYGIWHIKLNSYLDSRSVWQNISHNLTSVGPIYCHVISDKECVNIMYIDVKN